MPRITIPLGAIIEKTNENIEKKQIEIKIEKTKFTLILNKNGKKWDVWLEDQITKERKFVIGQKKLIVVETICRLMLGTEFPSYKEPPTIGEIIKIIKNKINI